MLRRFLLGIMVVSLASLAWAGVPDLTVSTAVIPDGAAGASMYVVPSGAGTTFDNAYAPGGARVDATITLTLVDTQGDPIFLFPFEDLWLETSTGSLVACTNGVSADQSTDENGQTTWSNAVRGGVDKNLMDDAETLSVIVSGAALQSGTLNIRFNSADMNADLFVNLGDITLFSQILGGAYDFAGDFNNDSEVNLSDIVLFTGGLGAVCN